MVIIYDLIIRLFYSLICIASFRNEKARQWILGRKNFFSSIENKLSPTKPVIWFHCASLGEFEQGRPVIEELRKAHPEHQIVLTFFSPSGYLVRKNYEQADLICYLPLDTRKNAVRFIETIKPEKVFFVKYEFWYHYITELKDRNIPTYIISAIFRENQAFFKPWGGWYRKILDAFTMLFVQDQESKNLLERYNINKVIVSGDTRFDRVCQIAKQSKELPSIAKFTASFPVVIIGSSWDPDEELLIHYINEDTKETRYIIAPHEVNNGNLSSLCQKLKVPFKLYSEITESEDLAQYRVLIIDGYGMLSSVYRYGHIAYIGGGFGVGIHNTLEAATYGMPVIFGPNYTRFKEACDMVALNGAFCINDFNSLKNVFDQFLSDPEELRKAGEKAKNYVNTNRGATLKILSEIYSL
ncbi:MAG: glycosyltransferase N-terminal domain-containing protein [Bacteroidota bacterium]|nr:glycosyltransferase N-terminal domain-containing protein [Bacteroidota bacterium]